MQMYRMLKTTLFIYNENFKLLLFLRSLRFLRSQLFLMDKYRQFLPACGLLKTLLNKHLSLQLSIGEKIRLVVDPFESSFI